jgi:hypothetical protein
MQYSAPMMRQNDEDKTKLATSLVRVEFPLEWTLKSITDLLADLEDIRQSALGAAQELPPKVRHFTRLVETYVNNRPPAIEMVCRHFWYANTPGLKSPGYELSNLCVLDRGVRLFGWGVERDSPRGGSLIPNARPSQTSGIRGR